jgi:hypothetical protein
MTASRPLAMSVPIQEESMLAAVNVTPCFITPG